MRECNFISKASALILLLLLLSSLTYASEQTDFSGFLNCFQELSLPITITQDDYSDYLGEKIPDQYIEESFNICCPEVRAIGKLQLNEQYVIVLYNTSWAGSHIGMRVFTQQGEEVSEMTIAEFDVDTDDPSYEKIYEKITIEKNLNILVEITNRYSELNQKTEEYEVREEKEIEKFSIDKNGEIQKGL